MPKLLKRQAVLWYGLRRSESNSYSLPSFRTGTRFGDELGQIDEKRVDEPASHLECCHYSDTDHDPLGVLRDWKESNWYNRMLVNFIVESCSFDIYFIICDLVTFTAHLFFFSPSATWQSTLLRTFHWRCWARWTSNQKRPRDRAKASSISAAWNAKYVHFLLQNMSKSCTYVWVQYAIIRYPHQLQNRAMAMK